MFVPIENVLFVTIDVVAAYAHEISANATSFTPKISSYDVHCGFLFTSTVCWNSFSACSTLQEYEQSHIVYSCNFGLYQKDTQRSHTSSSRTALVRRSALPAGFSRGLLSDSKRLVVKTPSFMSMGGAVKHLSHQETAKHKSNHNLLALCSLHVLLEYLEI